MSRSRIQLAALTLAACSVRHLSDDDGRGVDTTAHTDEASDTDEAFDTDVSPLDTDETFTVGDARSSTWTFPGVSAAGADVNGDGYGDLITGGESFDEHGALQPGGALLYLGSASGLSSTPAWQASTDDWAFGFAVWSAGDVNGDGFGDVVVWDDDVEDVTTDTLSYMKGYARLYLGSAAGLAETPSWTMEADRIAPAAVDAPAFSAAGDVNGDGYDDVVLADLYNFNDVFNAGDGDVRLFLGSPEGLSETPAWTVQADDTYRYMGLGVDAAGDVNGDGYDDVIALNRDFAPDAPSTSHGRQGGALIYLGSATGLSDVGVFLGEPTSLGTGVEVATALDVNGDGYSDVVLGDPYTSDVPGDPLEGRTFAYLGSAAGISPTVAWTVASGAPVYRRSGFFSTFGKSLASAGDVNGDDLDDLLVGASAFAGGGGGGALLYAGSAMGLADLPTWSVVMPGVDLDLFGSSVTPLGDVNADGFADFGVVAWNEGVVRVYLGSASGVQAGNSP